MNWRWIRAYGLALVVFLVLDALWLGLVARGFYREQIGFLLADTPNWIAATAFYLLFIAGLVHFVTAPAARENKPGRAALNGAFFGLVTYATYDLTNLATVARWPLPVTLADLAWGAAVTAVTAYLTVRWSARKR